MPRKQMDTFQGYTIWLHGRVTWKKRTLENHSWPSYISGKWSAPSTKTTQRSRQQHQNPWTPLHAWPSQQSSSLRSKSEGDQQNSLRSAPSELKRKRQQRRGNKKEARKKRQQGRSDKVESESVWFYSQKPADSQRSVSLTRVALPGNLHSIWPWQIDFWKTTQHLILSKCLIIQVFYHPCPLLIKPCPSFLYQSWFFFSCP